MKKKEKVTYEVDALNRLVYKESGKRSEVRPFRRVLEGRFSIDARHNLSYIYTDPDSPEDMKEIKLKGAWSLNKKDNLVFTLGQTGARGKKETLVIESEIIDADAGSLAFRITTKEIEKKETIYILAFRGVWKANEKNQLTFQLEKETRAKYDILTLSGTWEINEHNELSYSVTQKRGVQEHTLILSGTWQIAERNRLSYMLEHDTSTGFQFSTRFARYDREQKAFLYTLTIGTKSTMKEVALKGTWKVKKNVGLLFEVHYAQGRVETIIFGATCSFKDSYTVSARLKDQRGKELGISIDLSRKIFAGAGELFLTAESRGETWEIGVGIGFKW